MSGVKAYLVVFLLLGLASCDRKKETLPPPSPVVEAAPSAATSARREQTKIEFPEVPIREGAPTTVRVAWKTPEGTGVNEEAPFRVRWDRSDALADAPADVKSTGNSAKTGFDIVVKPLAGAPNATLGGVIDLVVCDVTNHSVCIPVRRSVEIEPARDGRSMNIVECTDTVDIQPESHALTQHVLLPE
jgi:hypothetical protein